jgi:hypothetical protein
MSDGEGGWPPFEAPLLSEESMSVNAALSASLSDEPIVPAKTKSPG